MITVVITIITAVLFVLAFAGLVIQGERELKRGRVKQKWRVNR